MIVASSTALVADTRHGRCGGLLPWTLLILGSVASLAASIAMADPTLWSRVIHAWPSFALKGAYELLMRESRMDARGVRTVDVPRTPLGGEKRGWELLWDVRVFHHLPGGSTAVKVSRSHENKSFPAAR